MRKGEKKEEMMEHQRKCLCSDTKSLEERQKPDKASTTVTLGEVQRVSGEINTVPVWFLQSRQPSRTLRDLSSTLSGGEGGF